MCITVKHLDVECDKGQERFSGLLDLKDKVRLQKVCCEL